MRVLSSIAPKEILSAKRPCIADIHVFKCIVHTMGFNETRSKLDAKGTKYLIFRFYEGMKMYNLTYTIVKDHLKKTKDVMFIESSTSIGSDLKMHPSTRYDGPMVVILD